MAIHNTALLTLKAGETSGCDKGTGAFLFQLICLVTLIGFAGRRVKALCNLFLPSPINSTGWRGEQPAWINSWHDISLWKFSLPVWRVSPGTVFFPHIELWDAAILCTSPSAYLAISKWGLAWYRVWIHSREEFSHTLPGNRFIATYPHTVPNSPKSLLMFYFNCLSQPADDKSVLNLQWGFGG